MDIFLLNESYIGLMIIASESDAIAVVQVVLSCLDSSKTDEIPPTIAGRPHRREANEPPAARPMTIRVQELILLGGRRGMIVILRADFLNG